MCHVQSGVDFWLIFKINIIFLEKSSDSRMKEWQNTIIDTTYEKKGSSSNSLRRLLNISTGVGEEKWSVKYLFSVSRYEAASTSQCTTAKLPLCQRSYYGTLLHFRTLGFMNQEPHDLRRAIWLAGYSQLAQDLSEERYVVSCCHDNAARFRERYTMFCHILQACAT